MLGQDVFNRRLREDNIENVNYLESKLYNSENTGASLIQSPGKPFNADFKAVRYLKKNNSNIAFELKEKNIQTILKAMKTRIISKHLSDDTFLLEY